MDFKCSVFFCVVLCSTIAYAAELYSSELEGIDVDEVLKNQRLFKHYINCLTDEGPCTSVQKNLKSVLSEVLTTDCAKCSIKMRKSLEKVVKYTMENKPKDFEKLERIYDPDGVFKAKFENINTTTKSPPA